MAKGAFYFKTYYQRFIASTQGWKDEEVGAYFRLLMAQFDKGGLENDMEALTRIAPTVKKNWPLLQKKFIAGADGLLRNAVMHEEFLRAQTASEKNTANGLNGGRPKKSEIKPNGFKNKTEGFINNNPNESHTINGRGLLELEEGKEGVGEREETKPGMDVDLLTQKLLLDRDYVSSIQQMGVPPTSVDGWFMAFNKFLKFTGTTHSDERSYRLGFPAWLPYHDYRTAAPENYNPAAHGINKSTEKIKKNAENQQHSTGFTGSNHDRQTQASAAVTEEFTSALEYLQGREANT